MDYCSRCTLDSEIPGLTFDAEGVCSFCTWHSQQCQRYPTADAGEQKLHALACQIEQAGRGRRYNCLVGVSGGTDSTYLLTLVKEWGLHPLAVHFDTGWNSEIAEKNMTDVTDYLGVGLEVCRPDPAEICDLQLAFLKASVGDSADAGYDLGLLSTLYRAAIKHDVPYILRGSNFRTEGREPRAWTYKEDRYLCSVHARFGTIPLRTFPRMTMGLYLQAFLRGIKAARPLNYLDYNKPEIIKQLEATLPWHYYGGHHFESVYTRFLQSYWLPTKYGIDKRKIEFAALIRSGYMTREEAFERLKKPPWDHPYVDSDIATVCERLGLTRTELEALWRREPKSFHDYPTLWPMTRRIRPLTQLCSHVMKRA